MKLTDEQKAEIRDYIVSVPRYKETFDELYDHVLNSLGDRQNTFTLSEVDNIINVDFGGFSEIVYQEKNYRKQLGEKYHKHLRLQFVNSIKWPGILVFAFSLAVYYGAEISPFSTRVMFTVIALGFCAFAIVVFAKIIISRVKHKKYSIWDSHLGLECCLGMGMTNFTIHSFVNENFFGLSDNSKLITMLCLFSFCIIYLRTFIKFYNQKFKILKAG